MKKPKYKTLAALRKAYESGELTKKTPLRLDNDCAVVYVDNGTEADCVFRSDFPPESELLSEALTLLGIPHESV
jgi:hypothetical protein